MSLSVMMPLSVRGLLWGTIPRKTTSSFRRRTVSAQPVSSWDRMVMFIAPGTMAPASPSDLAKSSLVKRLGPGLPPRTLIKRRTCWTSTTRS